MSDQPVTLITGTSRGIGKFLAEHYIRLGHTVIGCSRSDVEFSMDCYRHHVLDVADERAVRALISSIRRDYGRLDNLINSAGVALMDHSILTPASAVQSTLATNVTGTFLFCREASKLMIRRNYGRMVNLSTVAVPLKIEGESVYAASKAAVESLTGVLAKEFGGFGITVNAVGPSPVRTDMIRSVPKEKIDHLISLQAISRYCEPDDVANVIDFFLLPSSGFVTGQCIYLGGV